MQRHRVLGAITVAWLLVAGCGSSGGDRSDPDNSAVADLGHVHAIDTDPDDGALYLATHHGVYTLGDEGAAEQVAGRWQDTMAFVNVGPKRFLASGHPDLRERDRPTHLGLIESTDGAQSWQALSLSGEADFHSLEATGRWLFGYEALSGTLMASNDEGQTWVDLGTDQLVDLAAVPEDPGSVLATRPDGTIQRYQAPSGRAEPLSGVPGIVLVDWPESDLLVGVAPDGEVHHSRDGGRSWSDAGSVPGDPQALHVSSEGWHIATNEGLFATQDAGDGWEQIL